MLNASNGQALDGDVTMPRFSARPAEVGARATNMIKAGTRHRSRQNAEAMLTRALRAPLTG